MKQAIRDSLDSIQKKADDLSAKLSDPKLTSDINQLTKLNKEYSEIKDVVENWNRYQELEASIEDLDTLVKDEEMKSLALEEKDQNEKELEKIDKKDDIKRNILEGKMKKFINENTLLNQPFVKDPSTSLSKKYT